MRVVVLTSPNTAPAPDSAPRRIISEFDSIVVDVVYIGQDGPLAIPYVWMSGAAPTAVESAVTAEENVAIVDRIDRTDDGAFYKTAWKVDSPLVRCITDADGIVLEAQGTPDRWQLTVWFEDSAATSAFQECCQTHDVPLTVQRLESIGEYFGVGDDSLSNAQDETLALAYHRGYFEDPRQVSQAELAQELDISASAVGQRLRRGLETLVGEHVE
ncbi:bacterio-opsin activator HTH domain-containing protein [Halovivax asiaticus JCM 14624]|uniref:Bacterio-opsin activator HTH domain-containing protein n=1 Tax=Halovivax asiaticus JCM 14624 TaxID=1227490 RepID=M0BJ38_9EURY|nr:helix-turn-helix domain-containing protein [Halovivax asiaticus]ELZ10870.1 bacterio-opsin activator HTH domain-containing protein [Halovivax asiaticus JCM 14624]